MAPSECGNVPERHHVSAEARLVYVARVSSAGTERPAPSSPSGPARDQGVLVLGAVLVTVLAWASAFVVIRGVGDAFEPGSLALGRLVVGGVALSAGVALRRAWVRPTRPEWAFALLCGLAWFGLYNVALNAGEQRVDAGTAAMLVNVAPVLIALYAGAFLGEGFPRWLLVGAAVAFCGAGLIGLATRTGGGSDTVGVLLCLLAAVSFAVGVLSQKPVVRRLSALQATQMACTVGAVACLPFAGGLASEVGDASLGDIVGLLYLGLIPTAVAFGTWAYALSRMAAGRLSVTTYVITPVTVLLAWPLLDETPPPLALAGGALALTGVAITRRR